MTRETRDMRDTRDTRFVARRSRRHAVAALALAHALLVCAWGAPPAHADSGGVAGSGTIGPEGLTVNLLVRTPGGDPVPAGSGAAPSPYSVRTFPTGDRTDPLAGLCPPPPPATGFGWVWEIDTIDNATGVVVAVDTVCVPLSSLGGIPGEPPPLPAPPTIGAIWARVAVPTPTLGLSPVTEGVTGLATWIWATSPTTLGIAATINGYTVTGSARLVGWVFAPGDGTTVERAYGGRATAPALRHVYESTGTYALAATAVWSATVAISGPGFAARPAAIGEALVEATHAYPVAQVRAVLTE